MKNILKKHRTTLKGMALATVLAPVKVLAADPFETLQKGAEDVGSKTGNLGLVIAVTILIICSVGLMLSKKLREAAKEHMGYVIAGVVGIVIAGAVIDWVRTLFNG